MTANGGIGRPRTGTLAASAYVDPVRYEKERQAVFTREWFAVGDAARLAAPGAH